MNDLKSKKLLATCWYNVIIGIILCNCFDKKRKIQRRKKYAEI